ncbi:hypothetical protein C0995_005641, partial [Termitomyces sp. Mi166
VFFVLLSGDKLSPHIIYGCYPTTPLKDYSLVVNQQPSSKAQIMVAHALIVNTLIPAIHHWNSPRNYLQAFCICWNITFQYLLLDRDTLPWHPRQLENLKFFFVHNLGRSSLDVR